MYAQKEAVWGSPPHKNNLIGTAARGWTQIGPFKMNTKALFMYYLLLACSETSVSSMIAPETVPAFIIRLTI